ncbi:MAG: TIGR03667 family PPOX class F420-dependent oxidoreductase [Chloroflexota bacterium]|nr:TIGR03667 family PPOX class F420-dependent oxidoreductase [Chloroflexota bacterium]
MPFRLDPSTEFGARVQRRLRQEEVIWLTTVNSDGTPEPSPVWFYWGDESFLVYSRQGTPRERNLRRNPRVALSFNTDAEGDDVVVFSGEASILDDAPPAHAMLAYADKYRDGFRRIGRTAEAFSRAYPLAIRIRPTRLRGH